MILLPEADRAKDIAAILERFRNYDRDNGITDAIGYLNDLRHFLRDLDRSIVARNGVIDNVDLIDDLELLQHSVAYTLQDVWAILGQMPDQPIGHDCRAAWREIERHCKSSRQQSLVGRLKMYNLFASALLRQLNSHQPPVDLIEDLRVDLLTLRRAQLNDRRLITATDAIADLTALTVRTPILPPALLSPRANIGQMRQPRSQERVRPPSNRPLSPETNVSWDSIQRPSLSNPPMSPVSPTTTFSTAGTASSADAETKHWAGHIFKDLPSTDIRDRKNKDKVSECYPMGRGDGDPMPEPDEYECVVKMKIRDFRCCFWIRHRDFRTKISCHWPKSRGSGSLQSACLPLSELHSRRDGSMLFLCRAVAGVGQNTAWAAFKFPSIEFLIIFHCTFIALRSYDGRRRVAANFDHSLANEELIFSAPIDDSGYHHCLRFLREKITGVLRLEASIFDGEHKNVPIWTAFVTHHITSARWVKKSTSRTKVYLSDLKRHIFSPRYTPPMASGDHVLQFDEPRDAECFEKFLRDYGKEYRKEAAS